MGTSGDKSATNDRSGRARATHRHRRLSAGYWWASLLGAGSLALGSALISATGAGATGGPPSQVVLPSGGTGAVVTSTDCDANDDCTAVGYFTDAAGNQQGFVDQSSAGRWAAAQQVEAPTDAAAGPVVSLLSVSCPAQSSCEAVGSYHSNVLLMEGLEVHEVNGSWVGSAIALPASAGPMPTSPCHGPSECPTSPASVLTSVSCAASGECVAVGDVQYPDSSHALVWTESGGKWSTAFEPTMPADEPTVPEDGLRSVSCPSVGNCSAVGAYGDKVSVNALAVDEVSGAWVPGVQVARPQGASNSEAMSLNVVSCSSAGDCAATGLLGNSQVYAYETGGTWGAGSTAPAGPGSSTTTTTGTTTTVAKTTSTTTTPPTTTTSTTATLAPGVQQGPGSGNTPVTTGAAAPTSSTGAATTRPPQPTTSTTDPPTVKSPPSVKAAPAKHPAPSVKTRAKHHAPAATKHRTAKKRVLAKKHAPTKHWTKKSKQKRAGAVLTSKTRHKGPVRRRRHG